MWFIHSICMICFDWCLFVLLDLSCYLLLSCNLRIFCASYACLPTFMQLFSSINCCVWPPSLRYLRFDGLICSGVVTISYAHLGDRVHNVEFMLVYIYCRDIFDNLISLNACFIISFKLLQLGWITCVMLWYMNPCEIWAFNSLKLDENAPIGFAILPSFVSMLVVSLLSIIRALGEPRDYCMSWDCLINFGEIGEVFTCGWLLSVLVWCFSCVDAF